MMNSLRTLFVLILAGPMFWHCSLKDDDDEQADQVTVPATTSAGTTTGKFSKGDGSTQVLLSSSDVTSLQGVSLSVKPGTLASDTDISISEGGTLATLSANKELGLDDENSVTELSSTIVIESSAEENPVGKIAITIPKKQAGLLTIVENLAVLFRVIDYETGKYSFGIASGSDIAVSADTVVYETDRFGAFQLVSIASIVASTLVETATPITKIIDPGAMLMGTWGIDCVHGDGVEYVNLRMSFDGSVQIHRFDFFLSSACTERAYKITQSFTYLIGEELGTDTWEFDRTDVSSIYLPISAAGVTHLNAYPKCQKTDWVLDVPFSADQPLNACDTTTVGQISYESAELTGTKIKIPLTYVSSGNDGSTPAKRRLDRTLELSRR